VRRGHGHQRRFAARPHWLLARRHRRRQRRRRRRHRPDDLSTASEGRGGSRRRRSSVANRRTANALACRQVCVRVQQVAGDGGARARRSDGRAAGRTAGRGGRVHGAGRGPVGQQVPVGGAGRLLRGRRTDHGAADQELGVRPHVGRRRTANRRGTAEDRTAEGQDFQVGILLCPRS